MEERNLQRIAIVNRGEAAVRFIIAVREFNAERGTNVQTIALYTDPDSRARYVREADDAYCLGPATFVGDDGKRRSTYLDAARLEQALAGTRVDAAWVGWGAAAERSEFAELCGRLGIVFIGPTPETLRSLSDKVESKGLAQQAEVPVIPWGGEAVSTLDAARSQAEQLGYPVMLKAARGRGGRGLRRVQTAAELEAAFEAVTTNATQECGDPAVLVERLLDHARQVEVQVLADEYGETWTLGVRDCSAQFRRRRTIEEAPSPVLTEEQDLELQEAARRLCRVVGYRSLGTVEFLYLPEDKAWYFLEFNTRLQAGHAVTEMVTGADLVKLELHVASGGHLEGPAPKATGCAIGVRLHAEDPEQGFAASAGAVERFRIPTGPGLRVDTGLDEGDVVSEELDVELARVIAHGRTRQEALARICRALTEGSVVLRGGASTKGFLLDLVQRPEMREAAIDVGWLDRVAVRGDRGPQRNADVALVHAAIEAYEAELALERAQFYAAAAQGRPQVGAEVGRNVELSYQGNDYTFRVRRLGMQRYRVEAAGQPIDVSLEPLGRAEYRLTCAGVRYRLLSAVQGITHLVEVEGVPHRVQRDRAGYLRAPAPSVVASLLVKEGDEVAVGDRLAVLEAMKTETTLSATFAGRVRELMVVNNVQVMPGTPLLLIEPSGEAGEGQVASRVPFDRLIAPPSSTGRQLPEELRCLMLGFDADQSGLKRAAVDHGVLSRDLPPDDEQLRRLEDGILNIFVDVASLFRRQAEGGEDLAQEARVSTKEYLFTYLRDLGARGQGLPPRFVKRLQRALAHYGVQSLEVSPDLEESLFRIYRSHERAGEQVAPLLAVLQRRLDQIDILRPVADQGFMALLDRLIAETQSRYPAVNDVAREVRYRYFDQPVLEDARERVYSDVERRLDALLSSDASTGHDDHVQALVACPQPVASFIAARVPEGGAVARRVMLEVLTKRYYSIRNLQQFALVDLTDGPIARAEYEYKDRRVHLIAAYAEDAGLEASARSLFPVLSDIPAEHDVVIDFHLWQPHGCRDPEATQERLRGVLASVGFPRTVRRIVVTCTCSAWQGGLGMHHFTFRPDGEGGYGEEKIYRGLHPMMGKRLHLWRLGNFDIERLPTAAEDVFLFRGVARENPKDERLFGLAEVRDLTPIKDESGRIVRLPHLERTLMETLAALRRVQAQRPTRGRLHWNRVQLFVNPVLDLRSDELNDLVYRLAPATVGLGLENVVVRARVPNAASDQPKDTMLYISNVPGQGVAVQFRDPPDRPMRPLSEYEQKVLRLRQRGLTYPYELIEMLTPAREGVQTDFPPGEFSEYDLDEQNRLVPVQRPYGLNKSNVVVGVIKNFTPKYPEGMSRVIILGDPSRGMGSLAEPECRRINAALDLAQQMDVPLEWIALSAGARISMDSGVENMDWISLVLRKLIEYTQAGHEVNVVVVGINVGAQPYWNAEATMLMHTRGILIMTEEGAMVLTGKTALDYSGGVSAEDNLGIGGYERIMGPNGQAQYFAQDVNEALQILLRYYDHSYRLPGERFPRRAATNDPVDRDVRSFPHGRTNGYGFCDGWRRLFG
jgi:acetyl/propionyl-CoA carboxylase alpha subunit